MPENRHAACVDEWMTQWAPATAVDRIRLLERGVNTLWKRSSATLGPITLGAILSSVLRASGALLPCVDALEVTEHGLVAPATLDAADSPPDDPALDRAVRAILTEFLSVLSNLTADILTAPLHAELDRMSADPMSVTS